MNSKEMKGKNAQPSFYEIAFRISEHTCGTCNDAVCEVISLLLRRLRLCVGLTKRERGPGRGTKCRCAVDNEAHGQQSAIEMYGGHGGLKLQLCTFLTSNVNGFRWSASRPGHFTPGMH